MNGDSARPCRLVIFDFDGTLADTFPWFVSVLDDVADRFGFRRIGADEIESLRGFDSRQLLTHLDVPRWKLPLIATHVRRLASRDIDQLRLFPGIPAMLGRLRAEGIRLAIVSSNTEANVRRVLGRDVAAHVDQYACGASLFGKASRFREVLNATKLEPQDALCVGDEVRDGEAAAKVGVPFGAVSWGFARVEALMRCSPSAVFTTVEDIATTLTGRR